MAINFTTLMTKLGLLFNGGLAIQTALQTTIEDEVEDAVQGIGGANPIEFESVRANILDGLRNLQSSCSAALQSCVVNPCQRLAIETVKADVQQPEDTLAYALAEIIAQMASSSESIDASTPSITLSYGGSNEGNGKLVTAVTRFDGLINEHILAEVVVGTFVDGPASGLATLQLLGELTTAELNYDWPQGSGCQFYLMSQTAESADNLVGNGTFEEEDDEEADLPDGWVASVATVGTTVKLTNVEVQTITITGTATSGWYVVHFTDRDGKVQTTAPLAYNASGSTLQSALQSLSGLGSVTVATTGTSPDYTHTITFTDVPNPGQLTSTENTDSGSFAHATTTAGSANVIRGARALELDSDGAELTAIQRRVYLTGETQYAAQMWFCVDVVPAAGRYVVDLVDGIGGTTLEDEQGCANTCYFDAANLTTGWQSLSALVVAANEVQTVTLADTSGGHFHLIFDGVTSGNIAWNASAADVKTALVAMSNIGTGNVDTGGGALPGAPVTVTFQNALGARNVPQMTTDATSLTGGTPTATVATTTEGNLAAPVFRTPATMPAVVYLRLRATTAISNGTSVFVDEACMVAMTLAYAGGPYVALFTGPTVWGIDDTIDVTVANDRAGALHEWCNRVFALRQSELLLRTNRSGAETQADSLIA